ncbi:MAG TPA: ABC transporter permease, partial [Candidatus Krumholzibacteria bacterium]|nr:ABC transporter permease [Candidatus Krumholzibacteria bacterium]
MVQYLARRALHAVVLVAITLTITFAILHLAPGDPLSRFIEPGIDPADVDRVRRTLGLDDHLVVQYARWVASALTGDLGESLVHHRPVRDIVAETIPRTLLLTSLALAIQIVLGIWAGGAAARHRHGRVDRAVSVATVALYAIPPFYLAYLLIMAFAVDRSWLPTAGMATPGLDAGGLAMLADRARHLAMPVVVLGVASAAGFARFTRGSMIDALAEDYVRTARAKGLPEGTVVWRHAFRSSLGTLVTVAGLSAPFLVGGAVIVEAVFAWPGMGSLMVE